MRQNDENVEHLKGESRDGQEIDLNHAVDVIANECFPVGRSWTTGTRAHVFGDGSLGDLWAKLEQFAVDPGSAPQRIGVVHLLDQLDGAWANSFATPFARSAFPAPEEPEPGTVPLNDRARRNELEPALPIGPRPREPCPEDAIQRGEAWACVAATED